MNPVLCFLFFGIRLPKDRELWYNLRKLASCGGAAQMNGVKKVQILDGTTLKIIAMISMVFDHVTHMIEHHADHGDDQHGVRSCG